MIAMSKRTIMAAIIVSALLISLATGIRVVEVAKADFFPPPADLPPIYIRDDGTIEPSFASIRQTGETYMLTDNINGYSIVVQRDNIIIDGAGFTLQGLANGTGYYMKGIVLSDINNVTVRNLVFSGLDMGVFVDSASNSLITGNEFLNCGYSGFLQFSSNNTFSKNTLTGSDPFGISLHDSNNNYIVENNIVNKTIFQLEPRLLGGAMVDLQDSSNNTIVRNTFKNDTRIVQLLGNSTQNVFYQNNFMQNQQDLLSLIYPAPFNSSFWDNGSKGNFWSNYNGTDADLDGIGDVPYMIDGNNTDHYPLMLPINFSTALLNPTPSPTTTSTSTLSPSASITPSPSIPEFSLGIALPIFMIALLLAAIGFKRTRRISNQ